MSERTHQVFDAETGLNQNTNREYDPRTGRYRQFDPMGLAAGINGFSYAENLPLSLTDPLGLAAGGAAVGGVIGGVIGGRVGGAPGARIGSAIGSRVGSAVQDICTPGDPCEQIRKEIEDWIVAMEKKYLELQLDRNGLYGGPSTGTWEGHISRYNGMKIRLRKLIDAAISNGCVVPPKAYEILARPAPVAPAK